MRSERLIAAEDDVGIRRVRAEDAELFLGWWRDPEIMGPVGHPTGLGVTLEQVEEELAGSGQEPPQPGAQRFVIVRRADMRPIGELNYARWDENARVVSIGIKICEVESQRQGHGTRALRAFTRYVFERLHVARIELDVFADNRPARRLYERVGFQLVETRERHAYSATTGHHETVAFYALLRPQRPG